MDKKTRNIICLIKKKYGLQSVITITNQSQYNNKRLAIF